MADAEKYAQWIVQNADKKGTAEFETVAQAYQAARQQNKGNVINSDVPTVVGSKPNDIVPQAQSKPVTMMDRIKALYEVPTAMVAPAITEPLAQGYGVIRSIPEAISTGKAPAEIGAKYAQEASRAMQYQPTSTLKI